MSPAMTLSYRRAGTREWVDIDPLSREGQRLLALVGLSTTEEEGMTATTARAAAAAAGNGSGTHLTYIPGDNQANMGALLAPARGVALQPRRGTP